MDLREVECEDVNELSKDRVQWLNFVNMVLNLWVP